jgi:hypothetical protein
LVFKEICGALRATLHGELNDALRCYPCKAKALYFRGLKSLRAPLPDWAAAMALANIR